MIKRHPFLAAVLLLLVTLVLLGWSNRVHLAAFPGIIGAYSAKEYCSCRYVVGNPADYCAGYIKQYLPLSDFLDDAAGKQVTASSLGSSHTALWLGVREGCQLQPQAAALP
ncbi:amidase [Pseudomonas sp. J452]|uniref:amidase n=1 Tax=Pseudomonas sp. J452 TaxID=2898441 RepID=UPI0021AD6AB3|nr:amidase [Pseudomonas sp. J452]UUY08265.1 amidase [Pseudomonas sp. J452]